MVKPSDFSPSMINEMCDIINHGDEVIVKRERDKVVIIEVKRKCLSKNELGNTIDKQSILNTLVRENQLKIIATRQRSLTKKRGGFSSYDKRTN